MYNSVKSCILPTIIIAIISAIISCGSPGTQHATVHENILTAYDSSNGKSFTYSKYELPLSVDIYKFLKKEKYAYNYLMMHKLKEQDKYFTEVKRAIVMGVYSSDLAYAAIYGQSQHAVDYFAATIELANKLNIQEGYNPNTLDRAYKNLNTPDSLSYIVGESYWKTCTVLEKTKRDNILPLIVVGSWIESMHILSRNCIGSIQGAPVFTELYQQLLHLENLISFLGDSSKELEGETIKNEILSLSKRMELIKQKYMVIDASTPANFDLGKFKDVIFQIEDLRNSILE